MIFSNELLLHRVMSDFLRRETPATTNEQFLQPGTSEFAMSNEKRVNFNK